VGRVVSTFSTGANITSGFPIEDGRRCLNKKPQLAAGRGVL
jgi:hypothetical protein